MKKILILVLLLWTPELLAQTNYFVLNVKGAVKLKKTGALLKTNDQVTDKDVLLFTTPTDAVAAISTKNGRIILKPKATGKTSELVCVVSDIMLPGTGRLSTRTGNITNQIELKKFVDGDSLAILGSATIWISPQAFTMNQENFFFIRYNRKGESINKKLTFKGDSLLFSKAEIYKVDDKSINVDEVSGAKLFYKKGAQLTEVGNFTIVFPDESQLKSTINAFRKNSTLKGEDFLQELYALIKDVTGRKVDKDNVKNWLKHNGIKY